MRQLGFAPSLEADSVVGGGQLVESRVHATTWHAQRVCQRKQASDRPITDERFAVGVVVLLGVRACVRACVQVEIENQKRAVEQKEGERKQAVADLKQAERDCEAKIQQLQDRMDECREAERKALEQVSWWVGWLVGWLVRRGVAWLAGVMPACLPACLPVCLPGQYHMGKSLINPPVIQSISDRQTDTSHCRRPWPCACLVGWLVALGWLLGGCIDVIVVVAVAVVVVVMSR